LLEKTTTDLHGGKEHKKKHCIVIKEEYSRENSESQEIREERNSSEDKQGESLPQQINNYEDSNTAQNKSSFNNKENLLDQTSSLTILKRTNTIDHEDKTPMSQELEEMKEIQYKGSWKTVEKKRKATTPISPRKARSQIIKN